MGPDSFSKMAGREVDRYLQDLELQIDAELRRGWAGKDAGSGAVPMHITNIVSLCDLGLAERGLSLPVSDVTIHLSAKYDTGVFPASISHCQESRCTHIMFETGSCICAGAKKTEESRGSLMFLAFELNQLLDVHVQVTDFMVTNIVAACRLGRPIDMGKLTRDYQFNGGAPRTDVFPGFKIQIFKLHNTDEWRDTMPGRSKPRKVDGDKAVSFIAFGNGKVNCTGGNCEEDIPEVEEELLLRLDKYLL